jgi:hypothetical protein
MEREQKDNPQESQKEESQQQQPQDKNKSQQESHYAGTTQGGQGAPSQDGVESSDGRNTTIDSEDEHSIAGREDS